MMKMCLVPLLSIVLATLAAGVAVAAPDEVAGMPVITDGDSIRIGKLRIRIHGIDAPEHRQLCRSVRGEAVNGGAKLVHPGGAKLVHLMLCGTRCWGVVPVVHRRDPRCFV